MWEVDRTVDGPEPPVATIDLGSVQAITAYGLDPSQGCGSGPGSATKGYRLESSTDGTNWTVVEEGEFAPRTPAGSTRSLPPDGARSARYVRLTLLSPQDEDTAYWDFAELAVFGGGTPVPEPTVTASPTPEPTTSPAPSPSPAPAVSKPRVALLASHRGRARVQVRCDSRCTVKASASVSPRARRRAGLKRTRLVRVKRAVKGTRVVGLRVPAKARRKLRRKVGKRVTIKVTVSATTDTGGRSTFKTYRVRLRL